MPGRRTPALLSPLVVGVALAGLLVALLSSPASASAVSAKRSAKTVTSTRGKVVAHAKGRIRTRKPATSTPRTTPAPVLAPSVRTEAWSAPTSRFHTTSDYYTAMTVVPAAGAADGEALRLTLPADPEPGAAGSAVIASNDEFRYGSFGTRMRTADCTGQDHPGVITGTFTYSSEIDIEFLCAQPNVVYHSIWTDYAQVGNAFREITRAVDLGTGKVLENCYLEAYGQACGPALAGEDSPASVPASPTFDSATRFHTYAFDWEPDHVTFTADDGAGRTEVLWDYRGPKDRIPSLPSALYQNVTYTAHWDPLDGVAHNRPAVPESADIDSTFTPTTFVPRTPVPAPTAPS